MTATSRAINRLLEAINSHDPQQVADCFAPNYRCEMPLHPARGFTGRERVLQNWTGLFNAIDGLTATVLRVASQDGETWSEWELAGTSPDGCAALLRGPVIWTETDGVITWARFYLDRVDT